MNEIGGLPMNWMLRSDYTNSVWCIVAWYRKQARKYLHLIEWLQLERRRIYLKHVLQTKIEVVSDIYFDNIYVCCLFCLQPASNMDSDSARSGISTELSFNLGPSDVLIRRIESDQSFLDVRKDELEQIRNNILRSLIDIRSEVYHDEDEKIERQRIIDRKLATIELLEKKILELELECQRINRERLIIAKSVESERQKLRQEIDDLLDYRRRTEDRRYIREMVYEIAEQGTIHFSAGRMLLCGSTRGCL